MQLTYKYRIKDRRARKALSAHAYAVNQVWNYCAAQQRDIEARWRAGEKPRKWATHYDLDKLCKGVGTELGIHQQTVQTVCRVFAQARDKLRHAPRFRSSFGSRRALGWVPFQDQSRQCDASSVTYLGRRYRLFGCLRRPIPANAKSGCFVKDALGRWYVCFVVEVERKPPIASGEVGIDLGLASFAALSDGRKIAVPAYYRRYEQRLATMARARNKQRLRRLHAKIANCRKDFLHKVSSALAGQNALIAVGNVNSKQRAQTRFAKGVLECWLVHLPLHAPLQIFGLC
jgi:putative transposase